MSEQLPSEGSACLNVRPDILFQPQHQAAAHDWPKSEPGRAVMRGVWLRDLRRLSAQCTVEDKPDQDRKSPGGGEFAPQFKIHKAMMPRKHTHDF